MKIRMKRVYWNWILGIGDKKDEGVYLETNTNSSEGRWCR